jgi:hypothetical protein
MMGRRKKIKPEDVTGPIKDWEVTYEMQINGRHVEPGTELKISGQRGRFRFIKHIVSPTAEWVDVWGGPKHQEQWRSFKTDQVKTVHYKNTSTKALAEEYKAKKALQRLGDEDASSE